MGKGKGKFGNELGGNARDDSIKYYVLLVL